MPEDTRIISAEAHRASFWTRTARLDTELPDGTTSTYFLKVRTFLNEKPCWRGMI